MPAFGFFHPNSLMAWKFTKTGWRDRRAENGINLSKNWIAFSFRYGTLGQVWWEGRKPSTFPTARQLSAGLFSQWIPRELIQPPPGYSFAGDLLY
jgi:hypothetical protein